jgi:ATP-dependent RNA helicase DeaD
MTDFEGVVPALHKALMKRGYKTLTSVQNAVLAKEMRDADGLVSAQTGSGKTVAFGLAMAPTLLAGADIFGPARAPLALVVAPTRELALQVMRELEWLYEFTDACVTSCVGGMDMRAERRALERGAHIVVGTPGRLRDHIERGSLDLSRIKVVVMDEADEMLDLGFREDLEFILQAAPEKRRTLMFSATVPKTIAALAKRYQQDAVRITAAGEEHQHGDIEYRALTCAPTDTENAIINVLRYMDPTSAIVFCGTRATVNHLTSRFTNRGISVVALSGELNQSARSHALQALRDGRARVCVATDVAARGIDLPNLELVIHADLPRNSESLLHRSGRTGRAGRKGVATLIVPYPRRRHTERLLRNANIEAIWAKPPSVEQIQEQDRQRVLEDADLSGDFTEDERMFANELLNRFDAEAVAIAFLRKFMAGLSAPEELLDAWPDGGRSDRKDRTGRSQGGESSKRGSDFEDGVWLRLSVGRNHRAEPRWLLPMLCRHGNITKTQVGSIKIFDAETHVELRPEALDKFLQAIGPSRKLEKTITVDRVVGDSVSAGRTEKRRGVSGAATRRARRSHGDSPSQESTSNVSHIQTNELDIKPGEAAPNQRKPKKLKNSKKPKVHKGKTKTNFKEAKSRKAKPGEEKQRRAKPKKGRSKTPAA